MGGKKSCNELHVVANKWSTRGQKERRRKETGDAEPRRERGAEGGDGGEGGAGRRGRRKVGLQSVGLRLIFIDCLLLLLVLVLSTEGTTTERRLSSRVVTTKYGAMRGVIATLPNKNIQPVEIFLGIPYASAPMGKLRFMPPVTPAHWAGIRNADKAGPVCPQKLPQVNLNDTQLMLKAMTGGRVNVLKRLLPHLMNQSEDCLSLNIYAPAVVGRDPTRLPVMVFVHGESFEWNSGAPYDGTVLAGFANVVVVTINYRLGVLGFFPAFDGQSRGNFGLMDQVAALHWLQENIGEFGGDPTNVTVFGQGFGAACVNLLMLSPMARGLFHRAIMQSGSALSPWAMATNAVKYSRQLANILGCPNDPNRNSIMVECLRQKPVNDLLGVNFKIPTHLTAFGPTVDGIVVPSDPVALMLDESMTSMFGKYDLLTGVTKIESYGLFTSEDERHGIDPSRRDRILRTLVRNLFSFHLQEIYLTISNEYTDWSRSTLHPVSIFDSLADALGDATIVAPLIRVALIHSRRPQNTFFYNFVYATEEGDYPSRSGCIHGEELAYVFGAPLIPGTQLGFFSKTYSRAEAALSEAVMNYWANFVRTGRPNSSPSPDGEKGSGSGSGSTKSRDRFEKLSWPLYEDQHQQYLSITMKPKVRDHYHAHRLSYWVNLIPKLHVPGPSTPSSSQEHHLLQDHEDPLSYEGIVRETRLISGPLLNNYITTQSSKESLHIQVPKSMSTKEGANSVRLNGTNSGSGAAGAGTGTGGGTGADEDNTHQQSAFGSNNNVNPNSSSVSLMAQQATYSTALSVTIAIGCSLLILNVLVFAGVFYQRDKVRVKHEPTLSPSNYQVQNVHNSVEEQLSMTKNPSLHSPKIICEDFMASKGGGDVPEMAVSGQTQNPHNHQSPIAVQHWMNCQQPSQYPFTSSLEVTLNKPSATHVSLANCTGYPSNGRPFPRKGDPKMNCINGPDPGSIIICDQPNPSTETGI